MNKTLISIAFYILVCISIKASGKEEVTLVSKYLCMVNIPEDKIVKINSLNISTLSAKKNIAEEAVYLYIGDNSKVYFLLGQTSSHKKNIQKQLNLSSKVADFESSENKEMVDLKEFEDLARIFIQVNNDSVFECNEQKLPNPKKIFTPENFVGFLNSKYYLDYHKNKREVFIITKEAQVLKDINEEKAKSITEEEVIDVKPEITQNEIVESVNDKINIDIEDENHSSEESNEDSTSSKSNSKSKTSSKD